MRGLLTFFFELETYRNLALGAAVYVALFDRRYKPGGGRLDISETLAAVLEAMYVIVLTWGITLFAIVNYHLGGMSYSAGLRERYRANGWIKKRQCGRRRRGSARDDIRGFGRRRRGAGKGKTL